MDARHVPLNYSYRWIKCSITIATRYYSLFLGCGLLFVISSMAISFIPILGGIASTMLMFLYTLAGMRLTRQIRNTGNATFDDFLKYAFDPEILQRYIPFLMGLFVLSVGAVIGDWYRLGPMAIIFSVLANIAMLLFTFSAYMMLQNTSLSWQVAVSDVLKGLWKNVITVICNGFLVGLFAGVCALLCFLPLFLYFIPMVIPLNYLVFTSIFEGLDVDQTIAEWSSKAQGVQTIDVPADGV